MSIKALDDKVERGFAEVSEKLGRLLARKGE